MSDHVKPFRPELLRIEVHYQGSDATIVLQGEFDTTGVERFVASVVNALDTHPESIAIDAHGLTFIDSSGLTALLRSRAAAGAAGVAFRISEQSPELQRAIAHAGIEDLLADE
jgi:anti-anti-sigma factor